MAGSKDHRKSLVDGLVNKDKKERGARRRKATKKAITGYRDGRALAQRLRKNHNSGWRRLGPFGLFGKPDRIDKNPIRDEDGETLTTFPRKWRYMRPIQRILYLIYFIPFSTLLWSIALVLFLPWRYLRFTRPRKTWVSDVDEKQVKHHKRLKYDDPDSSNRRDVFAPIGLGHYHMNKDKFRKLDDPKRPEDKVTFLISRSKSITYRVWDWHCLQRDLWKTCERQGLQVLGVLCGFTLLIMEVVRIGTELGGPSYQKYVEAKATGGGVEFMTGLADCAYVPGTGFANWSSGWESFGWYALYHGWLVLLCIMLILDELLNVRMGLFAPQWSRGGTGYTIILLLPSAFNKSLGLSILTSSPNWGVKSAIPITQFLLFSIITIGIYNVIRLALAFLDCTPDKTMQRENRRNGRFPLRPWTDDEWKKAIRSSPLSEAVKALETLRQAQTNQVALLASKKISREDQAVLDRAEESQSLLDHLCPGPETWQVYVGDHCMELKDIKALAAMKADWGTYKKGQPRNDGALKMKEERLVEERELMKGRCGRSVIRGWSLRPLRWTTEDHYLIARTLDSNYIAETPTLDRFLVYDSFDAPYRLNIAKETRFAYKDRHHSDIIQPDEQDVAYYNNYKNHIPSGMQGKVRWESDAEFYRRQARDKKCAEDYYGNHNWISPLGQHKKWHIWFDVRRGITILVATWTLFVHVGLTVYNLGTGSQNWPIYNAQYNDAVTQWRANDGRPGDDQCQYYQGSSIPIWVRPGMGSIQSVLFAMYSYFVWELFIMHLLIGVILVGLSNNRTYGMHFPWPITLIGPRLSSVSLGWTIGFVGAATLQTGLFHYDDGKQGWAVGAGYCCIATWALFLFRNENMMQTVTRKPFIACLSLWAHEWMDGKLVYKYTEDAEYD